MRMFCRLPPTEPASRYGRAVTQYYFEVPLGLLARSLIETLLGCFIVFWCLRRAGQGSWVGLGAVGGLMISAVNAVYFVGYSVARWGRGDEMPRLLMWIFDHYSLMDWVIVGGLGLTVLSVTVVRDAGRGRRDEAMI